MSLVNVNHFKLRKSHTELKKAFDKRDWQQLRDQDKSLAQSIDRLLVDNNRDTRVLIDDLKSILSTYSDILAEIPQSEERHVLSPLNPLMHSTMHPTKK